MSPILNPHWASTTPALVASSWAEQRLGEGPFWCRGLSLSRWIGCFWATTCFQLSPASPREGLDFPGFLQVMEQLGLRFSEREVMQGHLRRAQPFGPEPFSTLDPNPRCCCRACRGSQGARSFSTAGFSLAGLLRLAGAGSR